MRPLPRRALPLILTLICAFTLAIAPAAAADVFLSNNTGEDSEIFFIADEPSLVINGFDLTPLDVALPLAIDAISISVETPIPGAAITLVVYQDANGGSPIDAELVHQETVTINAAGLNRVALSAPAIVTEPVVWLGFYLPVDFRFYADQSGPSVLTYWAWTPGGTFDPISLGNAGALGPGDGSEPISIQMDGVARITAEARAAAYEDMAQRMPSGVQLAADMQPDTSVLQTYPNCPTISYDRDDLQITARDAFDLECFTAFDFDAPSHIHEPGGDYVEVIRSGPMHKLNAYIPDELRVEGDFSQLPTPITHCMLVPPGDLESAVLGEARGIPEVWYILPSVRYDNLVCAEVTIANYISYFVPRPSDAPPNVNFVLGFVTIDPDPIVCGGDAYLRIPIVNTGTDWFKTPSGHVNFLIEDSHVASDVIVWRRSQQVPTDQFGPGVRRLLELGPFHVVNTGFGGIGEVNDRHRLTLTVDSDHEVPETDESDNFWMGEYDLAPVAEDFACLDPNWEFCSFTLPPEGYPASHFRIHYSGSNCKAKVEDPLSEVDMFGHEEKVYPLKIPGTENDYCRVDFHTPKAPDRNTFVLKIRVEYKRLTNEHPAFDDHPDSCLKRVKWDIRDDHIYVYFDLTNWAPPQQP